MKCEGGFEKEKMKKERELKDKLQEGAEKSLSWLETLFFSFGAPAILKTCKSWHECLLEIDSNLQSEFCLHKHKKLK